MEIKYQNTIDEKFEELLTLLEESFGVVATKERIVELFADSSIYPLIALVEDRIVGYVQIRKTKDYLEDTDRFWLSYVCVKKEYQRKGIATAMLQEVERLALEENVSTIDFTSGYDRKEAHGCYLKNGYQIRKSALFRKELK